MQGRAAMPNVRPAIYYKGKVIKELKDGYWLFEVNGKLYSNLLKSCLDYSVQKIFPGMEFTISDFVLEVCNLVQEEYLQSNSNE